jgi:glutamate--cysteine ligase
MGLGHRYGRRMQMISGIHYNWSMSGVSTEAYFGLIRNFRRHSFLLLYLFGASPAACSTFVAGRQHDLEPLNPHTLYMPYGTSLRMGRLGYQSDAQAALAVSYNSLKNYAASLQDALTRPYPVYEALGIRDPAGAYNQLATSLLQIENEFYSVIRPKRVIFPGERPLHALRQRGVEYVEVRCMDINPFVAVGIDTQTMRFIDMLLLHCLLTDSPPDTPQEIAALGQNQHLVATRGREPGLVLDRGGNKIALTEWSAQVLEECQAIAARLDAVFGGSGYRDALESAHTALRDAAGLPSARVLAKMACDFDNSYVHFTQAQSEQAKAALMKLSFPAGRETYFRGLAQQSFDEQKRIESADTVPFEIYRQNYLSPSSLGG